VPQREDPGIVACSMILSGLRVFDIRDPHHPKEIAYFNAPIPDRSVLDPSNFAMSAPAFAPERKEIWYSDGFSGFYVVRVTNDAWPAATSPAEPPAPAPEPADPTAPDTPAAGEPAAAALPATGRSLPVGFALLTLVGGLLLVWSIRGSRPRRRLLG
jgi:hypothetical protein